MSGEKKTIPVKLSFRNITLLTLEQFELLRVWIPPDRLEQKPRKKKTK